MHNIKWCQSIIVWMDFSIIKQNEADETAVFRNNKTKHHRFFLLRNAQENAMTQIKELFEEVHH